MEENSEILEYHCTNCGTRVSKEDIRCPSCGAELEGFDDDKVDVDTFTTEDEEEIRKNESLEYYCPECGLRVSVDDKKCPGCGAELDKIKDNFDTTIELKKYTNDVDAELAKTLLQSKGIECFLKGGNSLGSAFSPNPIKLIVLRRDMERALEILKS